MKTILILLFASTAHALDYNLGYLDTPPPAQAATRIVAAAPMGYGTNANGDPITARWTEVNGRWARVGPSNEVLAWEQPPQVSAQAAPPYSAQSSLPPPMPLQYAPPQMVNAEPAAFNFQPQCTSGNCSMASPFSFAQPTCSGPGCSTCRNCR